ncbi:hypothetical protein TWF694_003662 [Orbilia ellipsospora]|uniref:Uncharacterized protein n=1 Tax=Orbilia ellipsospora TaxID=2528407 RepID=A0AAV9X130_9PEZI
MHYNHRWSGCVARFHFVRRLFVGDYSSRRSSETAAFTSSSGSRTSFSTSSGSVLVTSALGGVSSGITSNDSTGTVSNSASSTTNGGSSNTISNGSSNTISNGSSNTISNGSSSTVSNFPSGTSSGSSPNGAVNSSGSSGSGSASSSGNGVASSPGSILSSSTTLDVYDVITDNALQDYCTTFLGYFSPSTAVSSTVYTSTYTVTTTNTTTTTTTATETLTTTIYYSTTYTPGSRHRKNLEYDGYRYPYMHERDPTPSQLMNYPSSAIASGCLRAITSPTETATSYDVTSTYPTLSVTSIFTSTSISVFTEVPVVSAIETIAGYQAYAMWDATDNGDEGPFQGYNNIGWQYQYYSMTADIYQFTVNNVADKVSYMTVNYEPNTGFWYYTASISGEIFYLCQQKIQESMADYMVLLVADSAFLGGAGDYSALAYEYYPADNEGNLANGEYYSDGLLLRLCSNIVYAWPSSLDTTYNVNCGKLGSIWSIRGIDTDGNPA